MLPGHALEMTTEEERARGVRRFYLPVANPLDAPAPLRAEGGAETRVEPSLEVAREVSLTVEGAAGQVTLAMPAFESLGRQAPHREFRRLQLAGIPPGNNRCAGAGAAGAVGLAAPDVCCRLGDALHAGAPSASGKRHPQWLHRTAGAKLSR